MKTTKEKRFLLAESSLAKMTFHSVSSQHENYVFQSRKQCISEMFEITCQDTLEILVSLFVQLGTHNVIIQAANRLIKMRTREGRQVCDRVRSQYEKAISQRDQVWDQIFPYLP